MFSKLRVLLFFLILVSVLFQNQLHSSQKQPYLFDVNLAEKPSTVQGMINDYSKGLPDFPLAVMTEVELDGPISIWLYKETAHFLDLLVKTDKSDFVWPRDDESCANHDSFLMPSILPDGSSTQCQNTFNNIKSSLSNLDGCRGAAEPEMYVLNYPPGVVNDSNTNTVLDLIGIMGSTFTQFPPLYDGVLPEDFVPRLRNILRKLRYGELIFPLNFQIDSFKNGLNLLAANEECFVEEGRKQLKYDIEAIISEATALRDHIEKLKSDGEKEYNKEILRLGAISRLRNELPYPSLTQSDREFLAFWLGGLYWRLRGGGIIKLGGTQDCRRLGLRRPFNVIGEFAGAAHGKEAADGIYCEIFSGWGEWFDMGTTPGEDDKYYDLVKMTNRGYEQIRTAVSGTSALNTCTIPDAPFVLNIDGLSKKNYDTTELTAAGLTMGPCYYFPWDQLYPWFWAYDMPPPYIQAIDGPTAIGEVCIGGTLGLGMVRVLMKGWATGQPPTCIIDCAGRECGDNSCGDECGFCDNELICNESGKCVESIEEPELDEDTSFPDEDTDFQDESTDIPDEDFPVTDHSSPVTDEDNTDQDITDNPDTEADDEKTVKDSGCGCTVIRTFP